MPGFSPWQLELLYWLYIVLQVACITEVFLGLIEFLIMTFDTKLIRITPSIGDYTVFFHPFGSVPVLSTVKKRVDNPYQCITG